MGAATDDEERPATSSGTVVKHDLRVRLVWATAPLAVVGAVLALLFFQGRLASTTAVTLPCPDSAVPHPAVVVLLGPLAYLLPYCGPPLASMRDLECLLVSAASIAMPPAVALIRGRRWKILYWLSIALWLTVGCSFFAMWSQG